MYFDYPLPLSSEAIDASKKSALASASGVPVRPGNPLPPQPQLQTSAKTEPELPEGLTEREIPFVKLLLVLDPTGWFSDSWKIVRKTEAAYAEIEKAGGLLAPGRAYELFAAHVPSTVQNPFQPAAGGAR